MLPMEKFVDTVSKAVIRSMIMSNKPSRARLTGFGTVTKVVELLQTRKKIIVLTGAGVSTSCGIPDFRSKNGIYSMIGHFNLAEPVRKLLIVFCYLPDLNRHSGLPFALQEQLFDIEYFKRDVKPFFQFSSKLWPGTHKASPSHLFIAALEKHGSLLRNYSQNIVSLVNMMRVRVGCA